jgi:ParB family chromosome partitioning protein
MSVIQPLDPFRCRMWDMHDRLEGQINEHTCKKEIESFSRHGQLVPVVARPLRNDPTHDFELIFGARRLFVARLLNVPLMAEIRGLSDREAFIAMDIENRHRKNVSAYERGMSYLRWLRAGKFTSQEELARTLDVSESQLARLLKLARLPSVIIAAFASPVEITEHWGVELARAIEDPERCRLTIARARSIAALETALPPQEVFRQLLAAATRDRALLRKRRDEVTAGSNGEPLFRTQFRRTSVAFVVSIDEMSEGFLGRMQDALAGLLEEEKLRVRFRHGKHGAARGVQKESRRGSGSAIEAAPRRA